MTKSPSKIKLPISLGNGLVLRRSSGADAEALSDFNARVHSDEGPDKPDQRVWVWTHDLMTKPHPTFSSSDFTIVEDVDKEQIVSAMNLIPQTWTYAGIPFKVGRPELVGTLPKYRNQGLVRRQFEIIHQWSAGEGDRVQAITGIPYYYRQFGYEMAMNLSGGRTGFTAHIKKLTDGSSEAYLIRPAIEADIPFLSELYNAGCQRSLVACLRDEAIWKDELTGKGEKNVQRQVICIIETNNTEQVGFLSHPAFTWGDTMVVLSYEITPWFSWKDVT